MTKNLMKFYIFNYPDKFGSANFVNPKLLDVLKKSRKKKLNGAYGSVVFETQKEIAKYKEENYGKDRFSEYHKFLEFVDFDINTFRKRLALQEERRKLLQEEYDNYKSQKSKEIFELFSYTPEKIEFSHSVEVDEMYQAVIDQKNRIPFSQECFINAEESEDN